MEKVDTRNKRMIVLPEGCFCGNCMECIYADRSDWNGDRVYCRCQKRLDPRLQPPGRSERLHLV